MKSDFVALALWEELEYRRHHRPVAPNVYVSGWYECDIASVTKSGYWWEFEIKVSRSDFKRDAAKSSTVGYKGPTVLKHDELARGDKGPARFCYVTPAGLLRPEEVPAFAGLWEVSVNGRVHEIKPPPVRHKRKLEDAAIDDIYKKMYWKYWKAEQRRLKSLASGSGDGMIGA